MIKKKESPYPSYIAKPAGNKNTKAKGSIQDQSFMVKTMIKMNIAKTSFLFYPKDHPTIQESISKAYGLLNQLLNTSGELQMAVSNNTLVVDNQQLEPRNKVLKEIAKSFESHDIHAITFKKSVTQQSFTHFLCQLAKKPTPSLFQKAIAGIDIQSIDYGKFYITREKKIHRSPSQQLNRSKKQHISFLISSLSSKTSLNNNTFSFTDPVGLASSLNCNELEIKPVAKLFGSITPPRVHTGENQASQKISEETLLSDNLNHFLDILNPPLRKQFLSMTFTNYCENSGHDVLEQPSESVDRDMILEMLHRTNTEKREISPHMLIIIKRMLSVFDPDTKTPAQKITNSNKDAASALDHLFHREQSETYIENDYNSLLKTISNESSTPDIAPEDFDLSFHVKSLENQNLKIQMAGIYLSLLKQDPTIEEYKDFSAALTSSLTTILGEGRYSILLRALGTFLHHRRTSTNAKIRLLAEKNLNRFKQPLILHTILKTIDNTNDPVVLKKLKRFLLILGPEIIPFILVWCGNKHDLQNKKNLLKVVTGFDTALVDDIKKQSHNLDPFFIKNMILLLTALGNDNTMGLLRKFQNHDHFDIKLQAITALSIMNDGQAVQTLCRLLRSKDEAISFKAIHAAGQVGTDKVVKEMASCISLSLYLSKRLLYKNIEIIKVLGKVGHPLSLPVLKKIIAKSWSFSPKNLKKEKLAIYQSLKGYTPESRLDLTNQGLKSRNKTIQQTCQALLSND